MSGGKGLLYAYSMKKNQTHTPELISKPIAKMEAHDENNSDDVVIVENVV